MCMAENMLSTIVFVNTSKLWGFLGIIPNYTTCILFPSSVSYHLIYSLCPKKNVILEILGQIIKEVKWPQLPLFIYHIRC
jgi:hypothetical protein